MGNYLSEPILDWENASEYGSSPDSRVQYASVNVQGWRKTQQDYLFHQFDIETKHYIPPVKKPGQQSDQKEDSDEAEKDGVEDEKQQDGNQTPGMQTTRSMLKKSNVSQGSKVKKTVRIVTSDNEDEDAKNPELDESPVKLKDGKKKGIDGEIYRQEDSLIGSQEDIIGKSLNKDLKGKLKLNIGEAASQSQNEGLQSILKEGDENEEPIAVNKSARVKFVDKQLRASKLKLQLTKSLFVQDNIARYQRRIDEDEAKSKIPASKKPIKQLTSSNTKDINSLYSEIETEKPPDTVNGGPFHIFAVIDGHRGHAVAEFIKNHLMDVILRNENIMVKKYHSIGLKQVFLKLDEVLSTKAAQEEMKDILGIPESTRGTIFKPIEDPELRKQHANPAWKCGAALSVTLITSNQVFTASAGDCRVVMSTLKGTGKYQVQFAELSRDHRAGKGVQQDEKLRITKAGFAIREGRVVTGKEEAQTPQEILSGSPITRCLGDLRFKQKTTIGIDKQPIIAVPEVRLVDEWQPMDWVLMGSSGFWDINKCQSKATVEKIKKVKFDEVAQANKKVPKDQKAHWQTKSEALKDVLVNVIKEGIGRDRPKHGQPKIENQMAVPGYANTSAYLIRLRKRPTVWIDKAKIEAEAAAKRAAEEAEAAGEGGEEKPEGLQEG